MGNCIFNCIFKPVQPLQLKHPHLVSSSSRKTRKMGVAQNSRARFAQVLVVGSIYPGAVLVHLFEPLPNSIERSRAAYSHTKLRGSANACTCVTYLYAHTHTLKKHTVAYIHTTACLDSTHMHLCHTCGYGSKFTHQELDRRF